MSKPFKCTSCGGPLEYDGSALSIPCLFCGNSTIVPEELRARPPASWGTGLVDGLFKLQERAANLQEVARLARSNRKIEAIKLYREIFGVGLEEAKVAVERMAVGGAAEFTVMSAETPHYQSHNFQAQMAVVPQKKRSRFGWVVLLVILAAFIGVWVAIRAFISRMSAIMPASSPTSTSSHASRSGGVSSPAAPGFASVALKFGSEGIGPGMFKDARNIGVDGEGRIYVGEYIGSGRIQVFDSNGKFITQWTVDPKMPMRDLTVDRKGTVYVVQHGTISRFEGESGNPLGKVQGDDFDNARATADGGMIAIENSEDVVRFNVKGQSVRTIAKTVSGQTDRSELDAIAAMDGLGNIYVLGTFNDAVFKYSPEGRFLNKFGGDGDGPGQFHAPQTIAVDGQGRVYVSDIKGIQVFDPDGRYLDTFKVEGNIAFGMAFNDKNELFVAARTHVVKFVLNK
jgi:hypothetical protein